MVHAIREPTATRPAQPSVRSRFWTARIDHGPSRRRGPFARWPRTSDGVLAVFVFVASVIAVAASSLDEGQEFSPSAIGDLAVAAPLIMAAMAASLMWRRRHPIHVVGFILGAVVVWALLGYGEGHDLALVVGLYSVGRYVTDLRLSLTALAVAVVFVILGGAIDDSRGVDVAGSLIFTWLPWYLGHRIRNRRDYLTLLEDRATRLEREQNDRARRAVADERSRIARELHDVVAHRVSMMTVQAGAAKTIAHDDIDAAVAAMGDVEKAGRQALGELRHLLGVLRRDDAGPDGLGPQPGIDSISELAEQLRQTGADVSVRIEPVRVELPATVDLSAYRIVQESVTNVIKHGGPNPSVEIRVAAEERHLTIEVTNTVDAPRAATLPLSGYGLVGMRERADILGGSLVAGPCPGKGFSVVARLPLGSDSA